MRTAMWMGLLWGLVGCGGGEATDENTDTQDVEFDFALCETIPFYDFEGADCESILIRLDRTMEEARSCNVDSDCQVISGQCSEFPSNECWYPANLCDDPVPPYPDDIPNRGWAEVDRFKEAYRADCRAGRGWQGCTDCGSPPEVACLDNTCKCLEPDRCAE